MWRLQPGEFLNDNPVDFGLKFSVNRRAEEADKKATAAAARPAHDRWVAQPDRHELHKTPIHILRCFGLHVTSLIRTADV